MALEEVILRIDESTELKGRLLSESEFMEIKPNLELIDSKPFNRSISRTYHYNNQYTLFEFFNKGAIQFDKTVQKEDLVNVQFERVLASGQKNEVTYFIDIEKTFYQSLQSEIESKIEMEEIEWFGEFYTLKNGNVLAKWSKSFRPSKFSIMKNIRAMDSFAMGLSLLDEEREEKRKKNALESEELVDSKYEPVNFGEGTDMKLNNIRNRISKLLNFEKSLLDFSLESIDVIDHSIIFNCDELNLYELFELCYPYIGEVARRKYNLNWIKEDNQMKLVDDKFNSTSFASNLSEGLIHGDHWPTVGWVIEDLKKR